MEDFNTYVHKHKWKLMVAGLLIIMITGAAGYYTRILVHQRSEAIAAKALKDIVNEAWVKITKVEMAADALVPQIEQNLNHPDTMFVFSRQVIKDNEAIQGCSVSFEPNFFKEKGYYFSAYTYNNGKEELSEQEGNDDYQYFYMDWYLIPRLLNKKYWIEPYEETINETNGTKEVMTSYSQPIHNSQDSVVGVLSVDVPLKWLSDIILNQHPIRNSYCMLVGRGGTYIVHPDEQRLLYETILTPTLEGDKSDLRKLGRAMISGEKGSQVLNIDGEKSHVFYMPFARTGWSLALVCPDKVLLLNYYALSFVLIAIIFLALLMTLAPLWCLIVPKVQKADSKGKNGSSTPNNHHPALKVKSIIILMGIGLLYSCQQQTAGGNAQTKKNSAERDKTNAIISQVDSCSDDLRFFFVIDSLENAGSISSQEANFLRGDRYDEKAQVRSAILYLNKAVEGDALLKENSNYFYLALHNLGVCYINTSDLKNCIKVSTRGYEIANNDTTLEGREKRLFFLEKIGSCQITLGHIADGEKNYQKVKEGIEQLSNEQATNYTIQEHTLLMALNIINIYMTHSMYKQAEPWLNFCEQILSRYAATDAAMEEYVYYQSNILLNKAVMMYKTNRHDEAETFFQKFLETEYAHSYGGLTDQSYYYEMTGQWDKLLELRLQLEKEYPDMELVPTLNNLISNYSSTFDAMLKTGHKEEALQRATQIINLLDTVRENERKNNAAELAVIYETQQKEEQIAEQKSSLAQQRYTTTAIIFGLVTLAFIIIILLRHRAANRLEVAHKQLLSAYDQLEETTTVKERIESELRIARDIQMSMVPSVFPQREGLEMYASMTPAREVGGDLYDYLLQNDMLYFCVGDVSGKGVPASLFMAQTIRLFRALAKQGQKPVQIVNELNEELSEHNENGMFVTMFIGLLNLETGHLDFCNAGHNPPVLGGDEQRGSFLKMESNAPIGLWEHLEFVGEEIDSIKERPLFIYTDGLNEAENQLQQQLGDERLLSILRDTRYNSPQQVINALSEAVEKHREGTEPNDDLTMMCIKIK